jgi:uncharacterized membrane protein
MPLRRPQLSALKARANAERTPGQRLADRMTEGFGSSAFLVFNTIWFIVWIGWNALSIPRFDPFPFSMLTMVVSLEAIFLSIFVLIAQNRSAKIDELRAEVDLQVNLIAESELTKLLELVAKLAEKQGIDISNDKELREMITPTNLEKIEHDLEASLHPTGAKPS